MTPDDEKAIAKVAKLVGGLSDKQVRTLLALLIDPDDTPRSGACLSPDRPPVGLARLLGKCCPPGSLAGAGVVAALTEPVFRYTVDLCRWRLNPQRHLMPCPTPPVTDPRID